MTKAPFLLTGAIGAMAFAALTLAAPAQAQERGERRDGGFSQQEDRVSRGDWREPSSGGIRAVRERSEPMPSARPEPRREQAAPPASGRNSSYAAPRDRSYGAVPRQGGWRTEQPQPATPTPRWQRSGRSETDRQDRGDRRGGWDRGNRGETRTDARTDSGRDWRRDGRDDDARRAEWQRRIREADRRQDWGQARRDGQRGQGYANGYGYRDQHNGGNRYGQDHRRWDNRGWRNDRRYDWYRYRADNRSIFRLGTYYAPYRGYSYSRLRIGFTLGSPFYSNRYWINDPWQYRLPPAYGPYRWIRYYDDALLVDIYSGEVVDVIYDFFW